jgi:hypothetical protein
LQLQRLASLVLANACKERRSVIRIERWSTQIHTVIMTVVLRLTGNRLKSATDVTVTYSSTTNSNAVRKRLELPKGTIIGAQRYHQQVASKNVAYTSGYMTPNISYHLKSHLVNSKVYGFGAVSFKLPA